MLEPTGPVRSSRMSLRTYEMDDLEAFHDLYSREDVCRYLPWEPMDVEQARAKLEQRIRQTRIEADGDPLVLTAVDSETGRSAGEFMLRLQSLDSLQGEIGWVIHPDFQGRGLATEGATEMLRLGFDELGLHRIAAGCDPRNVASVRVMERLGMRREAQFVEAVFAKGQWVDDIICAILESEWRSIDGVSRSA